MTFRSGSVRWRPTVRGGSYWRYVADGEGVTVFPDDDGRWKWVYEGEFSEPYDSLEEAMNAADEELDAS